MKNMNRIDTLFLRKNRDILSIYFTAGYPEKDSTPGIITALDAAGVDMIEIGIPFSDPLADGPVIQRSSSHALQNGMCINLLFRQLEDLRNKVSIPLILMSYINPVLKFGIEEFCYKCSEVEIDGVILPDLTPELYMELYHDLFEKYNLYNIMLIPPQSDDARILMIDKLSKGFIYMVSSSSTTGIKSAFSEDQISYFRRIKEMNLVKPRLIGFGISDPFTLKQASKMANGAIVGSAFIKILGDKGADQESITQFINEIKG